MVISHLALKTISYFRILPRCSYGSQWGFYQRCLQAGMLCSGCTLWTAHEVLQTQISFCLYQIYYFFHIAFFLLSTLYRFDVSQGEWVRCNVHIQKMCHYPVFGLKEGSLYQFRVCAVNKAGVGRHSKATDPIRTEDPLKHTRTAGKWQTDIKLQKLF